MLLIVVMTFDDMSRFVIDPSTVKSPELTVVMAFELILTLTKCWYCGNPLGTLLS